MLLILLFIFQTNVYTRHYAFPFIPYPFYFIPFYYGLNASNTGASPFSPFSFSLPFSFPFPFLPRYTIYSIYHTQQVQKTAIYCMPYILHICVLQGFFLSPSLSYPLPIYALFVFLCVHLFTILYIILSFWADLSILSNRFCTYLLKLNSLPIHCILVLYGQDICPIFHHLLLTISFF